MTTVAVGKASHARHPPLPVCACRRAGCPAALRIPPTPQPARSPTGRPQHARPPVEPLLHGQLPLLVGRHARGARRLRGGTAQQVQRCLVVAVPQLHLGPLAVHLQQRQQQHARCLRWCVRVYKRGGNALVREVCAHARVCANHTASSPGREAATAGAGAAKPGGVGCRSCRAQGLGRQASWYWASLRPPPTPSLLPASCPPPPRPPPPLPQPHLRQVVHVLVARLCGLLEDDARVGQVAVALVQLGKGAPQRHGLADGLVGVHRAHLVGRRAVLCHAIAMAVRGGAGLRWYVGVQQKARGKMGCGRAREESRGAGAGSAPCGALHKFLAPQYRLELPRPGSRPPPPPPHTRKTT